MDNKTLILTGEEIAKIMPHENFPDMVETVFREWGKGNVVMPPKITLDMERGGYGSWNNAMPAFIVNHNAAGIKWVGGYRDNAAKGLPYIRGIVILTNPENGDTLAVMDGTYISDWRTGASAAVGVKYLARKGFQNVTIVGAGTQGRTATVCIHQLFPESRFTVTDISRERMESFVTDMKSNYGINVTAQTEVEESVRSADVLVMLTNATNPFIRETWIPKGCLIMGMGSFQQADDNTTLKADKLFADCREQAIHRGEIKEIYAAGKIHESALFTEFGEIVAGIKLGRTSDDERIMVVLVGLGAHDVFVASRIHRIAREKNIGMIVRLNLEKK